MFEDIVPTKEVEENRQMTKVQSYWMGFPTTTVPRRGRAILTTQPQILVRPKRLVFPQHVAGGLFIESIQIGDENFILDDQGVPARLFPEIPHELSTEDRRKFEQLLSLGLPTLQVSELLSVRVRNENDHDVVVAGMAVQGPGVE